ncbi:hypothetical protein LCGC14_1021940 [marine sediment metagenome]|uniref:Uncharacterized protein n=1 Tax=marine sediment metagenome TaxID=412755 RepID=A0A0F9MX96_9ZZZZ|nr:hypothetical protein [Methylophaga sp.]HEC60188.1 hypothetical protein [Methylophaga sp.]
MCGGVYFEYQGNVLRQYFPNPKAVLPIQKKDGSLILLPWGRRQSQIGNLPMGGWARLDSIYGGRWDKFFPKPLKIPVLSFMEKDFEGHPHWYDLNKGQYLQGLLARDNNEQRIYVVTIESALEDSQIHSRWVRVVQNGEPTKNRY